MPTSRVVDLQEISPNSYVLSLENVVGNYRPGQCFSLGTKELGVNREYSIYSSNYDTNLEFLIKRIDGGLVSSTLCDVKKGDPVEIQGPFGEFCISKLDSTNNYFLFIASGTGVAPFHSYIRSFPEMNYVLLHGLRYEEELFPWANKFRERYIPCISRPKNKEKGTRVTDRISEIVSSHSFSKYYLCGNQQMITDSILSLRESGVDSSNIFTETFF